MTHKHEPTIQLGGTIKCNTCGELLPYMEETVTKTDSIVSANRVLNEIAVAGNYRAFSFKDGFVVYARDKGKNREEVFAQAISSRKYRVYKRIIGGSE